MAYNKVLQSTLPDLKNFEDDNSIIKNNNSLNFIDKLNISKKIDDVSNSIDQIVFDGSNIIVSGNLKFLNSSNFSSIKSLGASSVLKFLDLDAGLKLNSVKDLEFYNNIADGDIHISSSINIPNNSLIVLNEATGSIIYQNSNNSSPQIITGDLSGGISVDIKQINQNSPEKYFVISSGNNGLKNTSFNVTYLSNNKNNCKGFAKNYDLDKDIYQIMGNYYYSCDYTNPNSTTVDALLKRYGSFWKDNKTNLVNGNTIVMNSQSNYRIIPQCTILRPCNDSNDFQDDSLVNHYFSGETHYIKIKNDDSPVLPIGNAANDRISNFFILDLTSSKFMDNLKKGFKFDILVDTFNDKIFDIFNETQSGVSKDYGRLNYLSYLCNYTNSIYTFSKFSLSNKKQAESTLTSTPFTNVFTDKIFPFGFDINDDATIASGKSKIISNGYFPLSMSKQSTTGTDTPIDLIINGINIISTNINGKITTYKLPSSYSPVENDFFYIWIKDKDNSPAGSTPFIIGDICKIGVNNAPKITFPDGSRELNFDLNLGILSPSAISSLKGVNKIIFKFTYTSGKWKYSGDSTKGSQEEFEQQYLSDYGFLFLNSLFCINFPTNHSIINSNIYSQSDLFYLYGDRDKIFTSNDVSNNLNYFNSITNHSRIKGGFLKLNAGDKTSEINQTVTLPYNQVHKKSFNYTYENLNYIIYKIQNNLNTGFNYSPYSNFQLTYIGNNKWLIN